MLATALLLTGCIGSGPSSEKGRPAQAASPGGGPSPLLNSTTWNDSLPATVCHPSGINRCTYYKPVGAPEEERDVTDLQPAANVAANLAWTPSSRFTEELRFGIYEVDSCGDNCTHYSEIVGREGDSPIHLETRFLSNGSHVLRVHAPEVGPGPTRAYVVAEQPFQVEITWQPAST